MRDGIPRTLPVPRKWQIFIECVSRPADRESERPTQRLLDAVLDDVKHNFPSSVLTPLCDDTAVLFPEIDVASISAAMARTDGRPNFYLTELLDQVRASMVDGVPRRSAVVAALEDHISALIAARCRQITEDSATKLTPAESKQVLSDFERVLARLDVKAVAERFADDPSAAAETPKRQLGPDDDLRGGP